MKNIWHVSLNDLHQSVPILLHFAQCFIRSPITPFRERGNTFPFMVRRLLMQATQLPRKMMKGVRLSLVHRAARSSPPHFVVCVMKIMVQSVLTQTFVTLYWA